tara:strand:- start:1743 stop:2795 length:1053 start_codon:yes stop_codon:yes gene_type:complete
MRVLVTGGGGFIGSHTCLALLEKDYEVILIDSFVNSNEKSIQRVIEIIKRKDPKKKINLKIINADIRDEKKLDQLFSDYQSIRRPIEAVIHFAGLKSVKDSVLNPLIYWDVNVNGTIKLLTIMNKYKCRTIVFSSSATIYGISNDIPLKESSLIKPINTYGRTKVAIEQLLNNIYDSCPDKWRIANLRYFNPIGAHKSGMIGEAPLDVPDNIFPYITQVAIGKREKLIVFGNDWPTKDGTCIRDYIHVMDLAKGHILGLEYLAEYKNKLINLNLGTGKGTSVLELINVFERVNNISISFEYAGRRIGDCSSVVADNSLATSCLGWYPKRSLEEMCSDGWRWQSTNPDGYQ